jgi:Uma2 family endonuclease
MSPAAAARDSRVVLRNVTWETYEALLEARADDPAPRLTYDNGTLEVMTPSGKHERLKELIGRFIETFTLETGVRVRSAGSTTFRSQL